MKKGMEEFQTHLNTIILVMLNEKNLLKNRIASIPTRLVEPRGCVAAQCGKDYDNHKLLWKEVVAVAGVEPASLKRTITPCLCSATLYTERPTTGRHGNQCIFSEGAATLISPLHSRSSLCLPKLSRTFTCFYLLDIAEFHGASCMLGEAVGWVRHPATVKVTLCALPQWFSFPYQSQYGTLCPSAYQARRHTDGWHTFSPTEIGATALSPSAWLGFLCQWFENPFSFVYLRLIYLFIGCKVRTNILTRKNFLKKIWTKGLIYNQSK